MIEEKKYMEFVAKTFKFLTTEFNYESGRQIANGNVFYDVEYTDKKSKTISISMETIENYLRVVVFTLEDGKLSDYDDHTKTFHLNQLTQKLLKTIDKQEFQNNNAFFQDIEPTTSTEKMILKSAKDLRLCLKCLTD